MTNNLVMIAATDATSAGKDIEDFEEMSRACMKAVANHWLVTDDDQRFMGACFAIYTLADDEMQERVHYTMNMLKELSAAMRFERTFNLDELITSNIEPLPLIKWWKEVKEG